MRNQCHATPEPPHRLRHLEAHVTASQDNQMFGKAIQIQQLDMRHRLCIQEPWYGRNGRVRSHVQEYALHRQYPSAAIAQRYLEGARPYEATVAEKQLRARCLVEIEVECHQIVD